MSMHVLETYLINDERYSHCIDTKTDATFLVKFDSDAIIYKVDSNAVLYNSQDNILGRFQLQGHDDEKQFWVYISNDKTQPVITTRFNYLISAEGQVFKQLLGKK